MQLNVPAFGNTDIIDISTWLKMFDILLKTELKSLYVLLYYNIVQINYLVDFHLQYT